MSKKEILLQPNNLIKSRYDFTNIENKLFYKILYNAQKQSNNKPIYHATICVDEFREFIKCRNDCTEESIRTMLNLFQQSILEFDYIDDDGSLNTFGSGLINTYKFNHSSNQYEITIHETLYKHITDFIAMQGKGYTALNMSLLFTFKGAYTQRFYTLMRLWSRENTEVEIKYTLDELRSFLKLKPETYPQYKAFKQKIIKRALEEINSKGNMNVEITEELRKNRKVETIIFSVIDHEPRKYFDKKENEVIESENIEINNIIEKLESTDDINKSREIIKASNTNIEEIYIPDETVFTKGTLRSFKKDFKGIDFKNKYMERAFDDAVMITLDRDDVEDIKATSYKFFKGTLDNKIVEYKIEEKEDIKHEEEMDKFW
ncbi:replication initiation protein [Romboutsia lituseburensis]|uniref:replication initiation protein n=1 Tax=Romboutsia lituseburensis TaxID=1537 RepID=UPI0022EB1140|nr:replication initiation protein [Romboutsia lituseburensis]